MDIDYTTEKGKAQLGRLVDQRVKLLGEGADSAYAALKAAGITGRRVHGNGCPVAKFVQAGLPDDVEVFAGRYALYVVRPGATEILVRLDSPLAVYHFIGRFDARYPKYADLESVS